MLYSSPGIACSSPNPAFASNNEDDIMQEQPEHHPVPKWRAAGIEKLNMEQPSNHPYNNSSVQKCNSNGKDDAMRNDHVREGGF